MDNERSPSTFSKTERDGTDVSRTDVSELALARLRLCFSESQVRFGLRHKHENLGEFRRLGADKLHAGGDGLFFGLHS